MKKTTNYARKHQSSGGTYNGAEWLHTINRCRPYTTESVIGITEGSQSAATASLLAVRVAFDAIKGARVDPSDEEPFDKLAHALGVACIRAGQIAGSEPEKNIMLPPLISGNEALRRCLARRRKWGKWELDAIAIDELTWALEIYETILQASSPSQMMTAADLRMKALKGQFLEAL